MKMALPIMGILLSKGTVIFWMPLEKDRVRCWWKMIWQR